jgi:hypothetical protein
LDKTGGPHKTGAVFYSQIGTYTDVKGTDVFNRPWIVDKSQFDCTEDKVLVSRSNPSSKAEIGFVTENAMMVGSNHRHLTKCEWRKPETKQMPGRKGHSLTQDVKTFCTPEAIRTEVLQSKIIIDVQWQ